MDRELLNIVIKDFYKGVTEDDVLQYDEKSRVFHIGERALTPVELLQVKSEASSIRSSRLWFLLSNAIKLAAQKKMFEESRNFDDVFFGKAMLLEIDALDKMMANLERIEIPAESIKEKQLKK